MKKQIFTFGSVLLMAAFILGISGCKKDDTPSGIIPITTKIAGHWEVKSYTIDGFDAMTDSYSDYTFCDNGDILEFTENYEISDYYWTMKSDKTCYLSATLSQVTLDYTASESACETVYNTTTNPSSTGGDWSLSADEKQITVTTDDGTVITYDIVSVTMSQLKLSYEDQWQELIELTLEK
jgi:hypothetical protein